MIDKFRELLTEIVQEKGPVNLFAILKMDELTDKWTLIIAAPWAIIENRTQDFEYIRNKLRAKFNEQELDAIAKLGVFQKEQYIANLLLNLESGTHIINDTKLNGFVIHEAYILAADRTL